MRILSDICLAAAAGILVLNSATHAGVLSFQEYTTDAGTGISSGNTYTHVIDFNGNAGQSPTTINDVSFNVSGSGDNTATLNYNLQTSNTFTGLNDGGTPSTSGIHNLLSNFNYGTPTTLTLTGLQAGTTYRSRFFVSTQFAGAGFNFTANDPGGATGDSSLPIFTPASNPPTTADSQAMAINLNRGSPDANAAGEYIYNFTTGAAQTSIVYTFTASNGSDGFHSYGFSNELVPEPGTLSLLATGGIGMLLRRRRSVSL